MSPWWTYRAFLALASTKDQRAVSTGTHEGNRLTRPVSVLTFADRDAELGRDPMSPEAWTLLLVGLGLAGLGFRIDAHVRSQGERLARVEGLLEGLLKMIGKEPTP